MMIWLVETIMFNANLSSIKTQSGTSLVEYLFVFYLHHDIKTPCYIKSHLIGYSKYIRIYFVESYVDLNHNIMIQLLIIDWLDKTQIHEFG